IFRFSALVAVMTTTCSTAGLLYTFFPSIISEFYRQIPTREGYRFNHEEPNGNKREEMGVILYPGTDQQELLVMGAYSSYDSHTDTQTTTMYTADKNGYKVHYEIKNRTLAGATLKAATG
ncbi:hypothetical protein KR026_011209, partial [Drosophila bipectinata]